MQKLFHRTQQVLTALLLLAHLYFIESYRGWFMLFTGYTTLDGEWISLNTLLGAVNFFLPLFMHLLLVLMLVAVFYRRRRFNVYYLYASVLILFALFAMEITWHLTGNSNIWYFTMLIYGFGSGPLWLLFAMSVFYVLKQAGRNKPVTKY